MKHTRLVVCVFALVASLTAHALAWTPQFKVVAPTGYSVVNQSGASTLYAAQGTGYEETPYILSLRGDRHAIGFDYGVLVGAFIPTMYQTFMDRIVGKRYEIFVLNLFTDWQWSSFLSQQLPQEYKDELEGVAAGCASIHVSDCKLYTSRMIMLANFPTNFKEFVAIVVNEFEHWIKRALAVTDWTDEERKLLESMTVDDLLDLAERTGAKLRGCSMFGVWGSRTVDGQLYSGRNLDWAADSAINRYKLVTVYQIMENGQLAKVPYATVGFAGFMGSLAGMSKAGLTLHEANLEEKTETYFGFPWAMRLRWIMENSHSLSDALTLWKETNNTIGFNFQICSAYEHKCVLIETMAGYSAYFYDNDPREANAMYNNSDGQYVHLGRPLPEVTMRTNHPYDPETRKTYAWAPDYDLFLDSVRRYFLVSNQFSLFETEKVPVGFLEAVNTTSLLGEKGPDPFSCDPAGYSQAHNILSVTFLPWAQQLYAAWEDGTGNSWKPASCSSYVHIDLSQFWS
jgi:hypothetical protein